jgi:uncharacterized protein (TIGR03437 family)
MKKTVLLMAVALFARAQTVQNVVNAASFAPAVAPGTWVAIFGSNLASSAQAATSTPFPTQINGVSVLVGGLQCPVSYVSPSQINALIPFEVANLTATQQIQSSLVVQSPIGRSPDFPLALTRNAPGVFTMNSIGTGNAMVFDSFFRPVNVVTTSPIVIYATGLGPTTPKADTYSLGSSAEPLQRVQDLPVVTIGGVRAAVQFAGLAPGLQGIYQINLAPAEGALGNSLVLKGGWYSAQPVTVPVIGGTNTRSASASIEGLYPASGPSATNGNSTTSPLSVSALLIAGTFNLSFDILPSAKPFSVIVRATSDGGTISGTITIDPGQGTWRVQYPEPTQAARTGDFSKSGWTVVDFSSSGNGSPLPFPANIVPESRWDPLAIAALRALPLPTVSSGSPNGSYSASGALPSGGHFAIGGGTLPYLSNFGGYVNFPHQPGDNSVLFQVFVDNLLVGSKAVTFASY